MSETTSYHQTTDSYSTTDDSVTVSVPTFWIIDPPRQGWQCPVCKRINAPFVSQCPCSSVPVTPMPWYPVYPLPWYPTYPWTVICSEWT